MKSGHKESTGKHGYGAKRSEIVTALQSMGRRDTKDGDRPECSNPTVRGEDEMKPISLVEEANNLLQDLEGFENKTGASASKDSGKRSLNSEDRNLNETSEMEEAQSLAQDLGEFGNSPQKQREKKKDRRVTFSDKNEIRWFDPDPSAAADESESSIHDFDKGTKTTLRKKWKYDYSNQETQTRETETEATGVVKEAEASFVSEFERFRRNSEEENISSGFRFLIHEPKACDEFSAALEEDETCLHYPECHLNDLFNAESMFNAEEKDHVSSKAKECETERFGIKAEDKRIGSKHQRESPKALKSGQGHFEGDPQVVKVLPKEVQGAQETHEQVRLDHQIKLRFYKHRVESLEHELQQQILLNKMVKKENRELQKALKRSPKSMAADLHRIENNEKTYVESTSFAKSSPSLWGRLRQFLSLRKAMSWKF